MRRLIALASASSLLVPGLAAAIAAPLTFTVDGQTTTFTDVPSDAWFAQPIEIAATAGVVGGYKDAEGNPTGHFGPGDNVTYAQAMKIAVEAAGYPVQEYPHSEMYGDHWASQYMEVAAENHFVSGEGDAQPIDRPATRAEVAQIIADAFEVEAGDQQDMHYADVSSDTAFMQAIAGLTRDAVLTGDVHADGTAAGTFRPGDPVNRAETVKMAMTAWNTYGDAGEGKHSSVEAENMSSSHGESMMEHSSSSSQGGMMEHSSSMGGEMMEHSSTSMASLMITYTDTGFSPSSIEVHPGDTVTFKNLSTQQMWVTGTAMEGGSNFDAGVSVANGSVFTFKFTQTGEWSFTNHMNTAHTGTVNVGQ